jgi:hypothetical protein
MAKISDDDVLDTSDVAGLAKVTTACVRLWAESGRLKGRRLAKGKGSWVFTRKDVREFLDRDDRDRDPSKGGRPRTGE